MNERLIILTTVLYMSNRPMVKPLLDIRNCVCGIGESLCNFLRTILVSHTAFH